MVLKFRKKKKSTYLYSKSPGHKVKTPLCQTNLKEVNQNKS